MNRKKLVLGVGTLMLAAMGAFAAAKTAVVGAYYYSIGGHCQPTVALPCPSVGGGCVEFVPEAGQSLPLYRSIVSAFACENELKP